MKCSKCGNTEQYYKKIYISGYGATYYDGDTHKYSEENGQLYDTLSYKEYKSCYCSDCFKKLTKKELEDKDENQ